MVWRSAVAGTASKAPYAWDWDTGAVAPGLHRLGVRVTGGDGHVAEQDLSVTVAATAG